MINPAWGSRARMMNSPFASIARQRSLPFEGSKAFFQSEQRREIRRLELGMHFYLPSGKLTVRYGKWPIEIDALPINSMVIV